MLKLTQKLRVFTTGISWLKQHWSIKTHYRQIRALCQFNLASLLLLKIENIGWNMTFAHSWWVLTFIIPLACHWFATVHVMRCVKLTRLNVSYIPPARLVLTKCNNQTLIIYQRRGASLPQNTFHPLRYKCIHCYYDEKKKRNIYESQHLLWNAGSTISLMSWKLMSDTLYLACRL